MGVKQKGLRSVIVTKEALGMAYRALIEQDMEVFNAVEGMTAWSLESLMEIEKNSSVST